MNKSLLLLLSSFAIVCSCKNLKPEQDIAGDYTTDVHYIQGQRGPSHTFYTQVDTNYSSAFHIDYKNDTIQVSYTNYDGEIIMDKLAYMPKISRPDTVFFLSTRYVNQGTICLSFYKQTKRFIYKRYEWFSSGLSGHIDCTLQSR